MTTPNAEIGAITTTTLSSMRAKLEEAAAIARTAEGCAADCQPGRALMIALDVKPLALDANRLLPYGETSVYPGRKLATLRRLAELTAVSAHRGAPNCGGLLEQRRLSSHRDAPADPNDLWDPGLRWGDGDSECLRSTTAQGDAA